MLEQGVRIKTTKLRDVAYVRFPAPLKRWVEDEAERRGWTISDLCRHAVELFLEQQAAIAPADHSASEPPPVRAPHRAEGPGRYVGLRRMAHRQSERSAGGSLSADDLTDIANHE